MKIWIPEDRMRANTGYRCEAFRARRLADTHRLHYYAGRQRQKVT